MAAQQQQQSQPSVDTGHLLVRAFNDKQRREVTAVYMQPSLEGQVGQYFQEGHSAWVWVPVRINPTMYVGNFMATHGDKTIYSGTQEPSDIVDWITEQGEAVRNRGLASEVCCAQCGGRVQSLYRGKRR